MFENQNSVLGKAVFEEKPLPINDRMAEKANQADLIALGTRVDETRIKVLDVEQDVSNISKVLINLNPNQEAKQSVSGYGILSLPKNAANGQLSGVRIKGQTWINLAGAGDTSPQTIENLDAAKTYLLINSAGANVEIDTVDTPTPVKLTGKTSFDFVWASGKIALYELSTAEAALTEAQLGARYHYVSGTKSTISAFRIRSVSEDETQESSAYVIATDADTGEILELRSLPNGTKDEIDATRGKLIKRVSDWVTLDGSESWDLQSINEYGIANFRLSSTNDVLPNIIKPGAGSVSLFSTRFPEQTTFIADTTTEGFFLNSVPVFFIRIFANTLDTPDVAGFVSYLSQNPITLIYQLATPIEKPIQVSGALVSYPSGTVYIEPFVADAGIYTDKMSVLHQDLPIKALEKLSKIDFMTGLETELDVSDAVIAEDKLSFTHPDLVDGDIVFFTYEYDRESTEGETEIEYYDSRYVIKDSVTGKFYKWHIAVADGVPSIELTEV